MKPPFFIVISSETVIDDAEIAMLAEVADKLDGLLHIRKPFATCDEMELLLSRMSNTALSKMVLHQCYDLAKHYKTAGIHLPERERSTDLSVYAEFLRLGSVSTSFHSLAAVSHNVFPFTYSFLSPIFDSISKNNYRAAFPLRELEAFFKTSNACIPLVALGGITPQTMPIARECGFSGIAVLGSIWQSSESPLAALTRVQTCFYETFMNGKAIV